MVSRALRGRKLHRGRGKSEKIDGEARFIIAVRASTTPGLSKAEKYALVENCAKEFGIVDKDGNTTEKAFDLVAGKYPRTSRRAKTLCEENRSAEIKVR